MKDSETEFSWQACLADNVIDALAAVDQEGICRVWNCVMEYRTGILRSAALGRPIEELLKSVDGNLVRLAAGGACARAPGLPVPNPEGGERLADFYYSPLRTPAGETAGTLLTLRDATGRQRLEEQLRQSERLVAIGRLAGGVAHDFNNLLTIIGGYGRMLLEEVDAGSRTRSRLEDIVHAADRAAILTSQLLAFSRRRAVQQKLVDLNHLISNVERMLHRVIGEHIRLETRFSARPARVTGDPAQLEQVIMNLAVNARDAMPGGGMLAIETSVGEVSPARGIACGNQFVRLSVRDSGAGIDAHALAHIFEPFFTTKESGRGTGMGLSMVHSIVRQHGGEIRVESEPGSGAVFDIYLPAAEEPPESADERNPLAAGREGTETILLVEDEKGVRLLAREILRRAGYLVLEAEGGQEAIALAAQHRGPIHVLLTDIVMPIMNGGELAERVQCIRPDIRVIYMSGYTDDVIAYQGPPGAHRDFIRKPFGPDALARKIRELLDNRAEGAGA